MDAANIVAGLLCVGLLSVLTETCENGGIEQRTLTVPQAEFKEDRILALAREFADNAGPCCRAAVLSIYVDSIDARIMSGKGYLPVDYESWARDYAAFGRRALPMAEVVVLRSGAIARISDGRRETKRIVLLGRDPLAIQDAGRSASIIHLRLFRGIPLASGRADERTGADVFVRTSGTLDERSGRTFSTLIASRLGLDFASVHLRTDTWFIDHAVFPVDYRFDDTDPPTFNQFLNSETQTCYVESGESTCTTRKPSR